MFFDIGSLPNDIKTHKIVIFSKWLNLDPYFINSLHDLFYKQRVFFNSAPVLLNFFMNWASNVAWMYAYNHHYTETHLHLVYLCPCLRLGLFVSYLCALFFIFSLIFSLINHITLLKQTHLFLVHFLEFLLIFLDNKVDEESE